MDWQANLEIFAAVSVLGIGLILMGISLVSYARLRHPRALLVALGFMMLTAKGVYLTAAAWASRGSQDWVLAIALMDFVLAVLLYFAIRKG